MVEPLPTKPPGFLGHLSSPFGALVHMSNKEETETVGISELQRGIGWFPQRLRDAWGGLAVYDPSKHFQPDLLDYRRVVSCLDPKTMGQQKSTPLLGNLLGTWVIAKDDHSTIFKLENI